MVIRSYLRRGLLRLRSIMYQPMVYCISPPGPDNDRSMRHARINGVRVHVYVVIARSYFPNPLPAIVCFSCVSAYIVANAIPISKFSIPTQHNSKAKSTIQNFLLSDPLFNLQYRCVRAFFLSSACCNIFCFSKTLLTPHLLNLLFLLIIVILSLFSFC